MALLHDTASPKGKRKRGSTGPDSSAPLSLPDSDSSKVIDSLKAKIAELEASDQASKRELEALRAQLREAQTPPSPAQPSAQAVSQPSDSTKDEKPERQTGSFFGF